MKLNVTTGDIVKLVDPWKYIKHSFLYKENLFTIESISSSGIKLSYIQAQPITLQDISPVNIDGIEDRSIYYDPIIAASILLQNQPAPIYKKDYSYYMDSFARCTITNSDKTLKDVIIEQNFRYVHEIQHYLRNEYGSDDLKINYSI